MPQTQTQAPPPQKARPETMDLAHDVFDRKHEEHLDAETLETVLNSLLALYPEAPAAALRHDGVSVAMPDSVPLKRNPVLKARSGLDLIIHDDRVRLLTTWDQVLAEGAARYPVHLAGQPDITGMVYGLDLRETHGVILTLEVFAPADASTCPVSRHRNSGGHAPIRNPLQGRAQRHRQDRRGDDADPGLEQRGDGGSSLDRVHPP